ncbi:MAG TPA: hypothetical protein VMF89_02560, partial [Polyangiales bacterium]|nr:hypothetical protein [Polyangiales bacterium]
AAAPVSAQAADEQVCSINQTQYELSFRDLPDVRTDFVLCLDTRLSPTFLRDYVQCRMYWKLAAVNPEGQRRCADFDYLSPTDDDPFTAEAGGSENEVCLVRQVTEAQHAAGESGWYYSDNVAQRCTPSQGGAVFPLDHPESFEALLECGIALEPEGAYGSVDIRTRACVAPPSAADASDVGKLCSQPLRLGDPISQLTFGGDQCASDVCLTTPLGMMTCTEQNGQGYCGSSTTRCSCRCAGESDDDPGPFCACPDAYECKPLLSSFVGSPETRGSYCVPTDGRVIP